MNNQMNSSLNQLAPQAEARQGAEGESQDVGTLPAGSAAESQQLASAEAALPADEEQLVVDMAGLWTPLEKRGLVVRHQLGTMLNQRFGAPPNAQERGAYVLERAAARLGISTSDLSRMRKFAGRFKTFEEFQEKHPDVNSWSAVKELIVEHNQSDGAGKPKSAKQPKPSKELLFNSMTTSINTLADIKDSLTLPEFAELRQQANVLIGMVDQLAAPVQQPLRQEPGGSV